MTDETNRAWKDQYMLRFPDGMRDRIKALAASNGRSMNSQIIHMLQYAMDEVDISARIYGDPKKKLATTEFLREEVKRSKAMLELILAEFEDPESEVAKIAEDRESEHRD